MLKDVTRRTKLFRIAIVTLVLIAGGIFYFCYSPAESKWFPKCPFLLFTGLKCPGCGSQRAVHSLLHFDFRSALLHNALLIASIPYIILLLAGRIVRDTRLQSPFFTHIQHPAVIWTYFTLVLAFWIARNMFGF